METAGSTKKIKSPNLDKERKSEQVPRNKKKHFTRDKISYRQV